MFRCRSVVENRSATAVKLVTNAREAHKFWSVWVFVIVTLMPIVEANWGYFSTIVPREYQPYAMAMFGVAGIAARLIKQSNVKD